jgi:hypothetical protein
LTEADEKANKSLKLSFNTLFLNGVLKKSNIVAADVDIIDVVVPTESSISKW